MNLMCRNFIHFRVFQELLYGISAGFGSPQVPVAEILARAVPLLHGDQVGGGNGHHGGNGHGGGGGMAGTKPKSSNFLQVPEVEGPRWVDVFTYSRKRL